jgi:hypothetical protein
MGFCRILFHPIKCDLQPNKILHTPSMSAFFEKKNSNNNKKKRMQVAVQHSLDNEILQDFIPPY